MALPLIFDVPAHSEVRLVRVEPAKRAVAVRKPSSLGHVVGPPPPVRTPITACPFDLGSFYVATDGVGAFYEINTEQATTMSRAALARVTEDMVGGVRYVNVANSGREIMSPYQLQAGTTETDGFITALSLTGRGQAARTVQLLAQGERWLPRPTMATRLAQCAILTTAGVDMTEERRTFERERLEAWDVHTVGRVGREGTVRFTGALDGQYSLSASSLRTFLPFDVANADDYIITEDPSPLAAHVACPPLYTGNHLAASVDVFLAPRLYEYVIQWIAYYFFASVYGYFAFVPLPQTGSFVMRLPFYPKAYDLNSHSGGIGGTNSVAMSERIRRTLTYARMILADILRSFISSTFIFVFDRREEGRWTLYQREIPKHALCAVLRFRYASRKPALTRYIWKRHADPYTRVVVDAGALHVPGEVLGASGF